MKKNQTIIVVGVLLISLVFFGAAVAAGKWDGAGSGFRHKGAHGKDGLALLTRSVKQNLAVAALSDLSDQPAETVRQKLKDQRMRGFLEEYNIDRQAFRIAMQTKVTALVEYLAAGGFITPEQAKAYNERIERLSELRSERRELMNQLIEKGLADGTITPEQAKLLQPKHFKD
jgi:hypothetical protein